MPYVNFPGGGNVGILPLQTTGRIGQSLPLLKAHAGMYHNGLKWNTTQLSISQNQNLFQTIDTSK